MYRKFWIFKGSQTDRYKWPPYRSKMIAPWYQMTDQTNTGNNGKGSGNLDISRPFPSLFISFIAIYTFHTQEKLPWRQGSSLWGSEKNKNMFHFLYANYKNNGSVSCLGIYFLLIRSLYMLRAQLREVWFTWNEKEYLSLLNYRKCMICLLRWLIFSPETVVH